MSEPSEPNPFAPASDLLMTVMFRLRDMKRFGARKWISAAEKRRRRVKDRMQKASRRMNRRRSR